MARWGCSVPPDRTVGGAAAGASRLPAHRQPGRQPDSPSAGLRLCDAQVDDRLITEIPGTDLGFENGHISRQAAIEALGDVVPLYFVDDQEGDWCKFSGRSAP